MAIITYAEWMPDQPALGSGAAEALNVIPRPNGYGPFQSFGAATTTPINAKCQGAYASRPSDGAVSVIAGNATKLYLLNGTSWDDITRFSMVPIDYTTAVDGRWTFTSFGSAIFATNGADSLQKYDAVSFPRSVGLGSPPAVSKYLATCKDYIVIGCLSTDVSAVQWCATNDPDNWPIGSDGGDIQPIPDCGAVTGLIGGDFFLVLMEGGVHRFDFTGGDFVFQRRQLSVGIGCTIPGTAQGYSDRAFFWHTSGFYQCVGGSVPVQIGDERVNKYFRRRLLLGGEPYVFSAIFPREGLYVVGIPTTRSDGYPIDEFLVYKWNAGPNGRWSHVIDGRQYEVLFNAMTAGGVTLEDLDGYGSLEDVPFPLDSDAWLEGTPMLGGFGIDHNVGWFASGPMPATLTTQEAKLNDAGKALVRGYRPMIDGGVGLTITGTVLARNSLSETPTSNPNSQDKTPTAKGLIRARIKGRYHRSQVTISGQSWDTAIGLDDLEFYPVGS